MRISSESLGAVGERLLATITHAKIINGDHEGCPDLEMNGAYIEVKTCRAWMMHYDKKHTRIRPGYFFFNKEQHKRLKGMLGKQYYGLIVINERRIHMKLVPVERMDDIVAKSNSYKPCRAWTEFFDRDTIGKVPDGVLASHNLIKEQEDYKYDSHKYEAD